MNKIYVLVLITFSPFFNFSQYCTAVGPTSDADSNVQSVSLNGDSGSINYTGCPGIIGLQDLTSLTTSLAGGMSYSLSVEFGTCGGNYAGKGEVWIDFNSDETFTPDESIGIWEGTPPTGISVLNFNVPNGIINGDTRMRIMQEEGGAVTLPLDPCATFTWGSVMDFNIELSGGMDCSGFLGNTISEAILTNVFPYTDSHSTSVCYSNNDYVYESADVHYLVIPNENSSVINVSLCGSSFDTFLSVFDTDGNTIAFNDDGNCGSQSELSFSTVGIDSAFVIVQGWGNENGDYELNIFESVLEVDDNMLNDLEVLPNPATNQFRINGVISGSIYIQDVSGKIIKRILNYSGETINVSTFLNGIYFVSLITNNVLQTEKLIIN